jgi:hypothetical protein
MKFYVKNDFYLIVNKVRIKKTKGEIIDVAPDRIGEFEKMNIIGEPVKEVEIETAIVKPAENEMIKTVVKKTDPVKKLQADVIERKVKEVKKPNKKGKK